MLASWYQNQLQAAPWGGRRPNRTQDSPNEGNDGGGGAFNTMRTFIQGTSGPQPAPRERERDKDKKTSVEPVFGPNIGLVNGGPSWAQTTEKKVLRDELTSDILRGWIEKSKDSSQPTTTLQALVNLKRPTLRLSPLSPPEATDDSNSDIAPPHQHGIEFEYDCDAPQCGIYVHVLLPPDHPESGYTAPSIASSDSPYAPPPKPRTAKVLIFETVVEGGFNKVLRIADGAVLELERYELDQNASPSVGTQAKVDGTSSITEDHRDSASNGAANSTSNRHTRRRFTNFHFRRRTHAHNRSVAGPALAVVDAEPATTGTTPSDTVAGTPSAEDNSALQKPKDEPEGVRIAIRIAALDAQGAELTAPNEQVTYLNVVRFGPMPVNAEGKEDHEQDDVRPWVVKVVKREATIGPHTFQLHEIFGLTSSSSSHTHAPTAPLPSATSPTSDTQDEHSYPPMSPPAPPVVAVAPGDDETPSECLVCLSSPREVVLLPCRHLVACKECALNMVEFGAGGNITQTEDATPSAGGEAGADVAEGAEGAPAAEPSPTPAIPAPAPAATARRKRKAKGWYCPVCRQPYASLLRITTTPPSVPAVPPEAITSEGVTAGQPEASAPVATDVDNAPARSAFSLRPSFFRGLSRTSSRMTTPLGDAESQVAAIRA